MHPDWVRPTGPNTLHIENQIVYDIQDYLHKVMIFMDKHGKQMQENDMKILGAPLT